MPVLKKASRAQILDAALTRSDRWADFEVFALTENMRVEKEVKNPGSDRSKLEWFAMWLLRVGNGEEEHDESERIALPPELCMEEGADVDALVDWVFPDLAEHCRRGDDAWLAERAVLAPLNAQVEPFPMPDILPCLCIHLLTQYPISTLQPCALYLIPHWFLTRWTISMTR